MEEKKITLLVIDDNQVDRETYKRFLYNNKRIGKILEADTVQKGLELYRTHTIDCVLLDYMLPGENGIKFIEKAALLNSTPIYVPLIMLTGQGNEKVAVNAMKAGAIDYLTKDELSEQLLCKTIEHVLEKSKLVQELKEKTIALERLATTDSLTGLLNRYAFQKEAQKRLSIAKRYDHRMAVLFIDLDGFKRINDTYSHEMGDRLLSLVSTRLLHSLREEDIICRFGGDEFVVVTRVHLDEDTVDIAKKLIKLISEPYDMEGKLLRISACIGIACRHANESMDDLIHAADLALYRAKRQGEGNYFISAKT